MKLRISEAALEENERKNIRGSLPNKSNNPRHGITIVKGENPQIRLKFTEPIRGE